MNFTGSTGTKRRLPKSNHVGVVENVVIAILIATVSSSPLTLATELGIMQVTRQLRPGAEGTQPVSLDRLRGSGPITAIPVATAPARVVIPSVPPAPTPPPALYALHRPLLAGNRVPVFSAAGGAGRSTVALGLAHTLAGARLQVGRGVAYFDAAWDHFSGTQSRVGIAGESPALTAADIGGLQTAPPENIVPFLHRASNGLYVIPAVRHRQPHPGTTLVQQVVTRVTSWWDITVCDLAVGPTSLFTCGTPESPIVAVTRAEPAGLAQLGDALAVLGDRSVSPRQVIAVVSQTTAEKPSRELKAAIRILETRCARVVELPFDKALAASQRFDFDRLATRSRRALTDVAAWVIGAMR